MARGFIHGTCLCWLRNGGNCIVQACRNTLSSGTGDGFDGIGDAFDDVGRDTLLEMSENELHDTLGVNTSSKVSFDIFTMYAQ